MANIVIPGYESVKGNQLYRKVDQPQDSEQLLHLAVYRSPTESAIVDRIRAAAQSLCGSFSDKTTLMSILSSLSARELDALADGAKSAVNRIRRHFLLEKMDGGLREGEFYLNARYISCKKVDMGNFEIKGKGVFPAECLIASPNWKATVTLLDGKFPVAVRKLIQYEVTSSAVLNVEDNPDYSIVAAELNLLCDVFDSNSVSGLVDLSGVALEELSDKVASEFVECGKEQHTSANVPKQETNIPPQRPPSDCSNN